MRKVHWPAQKEVQAQIDAGELTGPLAGVPVAIKDNMCTEGLLTTCTSRILYNFKPTYYGRSSAEPGRSRSSHVIGKTNMDEFAMGSTTETSALRTRPGTRGMPRMYRADLPAEPARQWQQRSAPLPWVLTPAVSIRQPSSFCGVTGIKPTYGTVSRYGLIAYGSSLDQIGPVGKRRDRLRNGPGSNRFL